MKKVFTMVLSLVILVTSMTCFGLLNASAASTPYKLQVDGFKDREVVSFNYDFDQLDDSGKLTNVVKGGKITIKLSAMRDGTPDMLAWMVERTLAKNGNIKIYESKTGKIAKTVNFTDAYCVGYEEVFNTKKDGTVENYEIITITCKTIKSGDAEFESAWA